MQDAFVRAAERWPRDGIPRNPGAWIVATARNRAIDRIRRDQTLVRKTELLARAAELPDDEETTIPDERLELIFACCHPALGAEAQVALTLSLVGGLTTREIARDRSYSSNRSRLGSRNGIACFSSSTLTASPR